MSSDASSPDSPAVSQPNEQPDRKAQPVADERVLFLLHFALREGGTLFLGTSETAGGHDHMFQPIDKQAKLFRRIGPTQHGTIAFPLPRSMGSTIWRERNNVESRSGLPRSSISQMSVRALLEHHTPAAVTIDRDRRIIYFHGNTEPFIAAPRGERTGDLMELVRENVRGAVRTALHRAASGEGIVTTPNGWVEIQPGKRVRISITVSPLDNKNAPDHLVVSFHERGEDLQSKKKQAKSVSRAHANDDLRRAREELQSTIEELQTSNVELKASHQEVVSINEELQSSNEELETSREEMQSLNEELSTVNLLTNAAVKFTPSQATITVMMRRIDDGAEIRVSDTGRGISADFLFHVFERFSQAEGASTRTHGGIGLGLTIAKQLVELHGGTIAAESQGPNQGATFIVQLPLLNVETATDLRAIQDTGRQLDTSILRGVSVLLVEDDAMTRKALANVLQTFGMQVLEADCAEAALELFRDNPPGVILSDIGLLEKDGYALLREIRKSETAKGAVPVPAIAISAFTRDRDRARALKVGFQPHLAKPVFAERLKEALCDVLRK